MYLLPQQNELVKMFRRQIQNSTDIAALGVPWANAVRPVRKRNISIDADINDDFGFPEKP